MQAPLSPQNQTLYVQVHCHWFPNMIVNSWDSHKLVSYIMAINGKRILLQEFFEHAVRFAAILVNRFGSLETLGSKNWALLALGGSEGQWDEKHQTTELTLNDGSKTDFRRKDVLFSDWICKHYMLRISHLIGTLSTLLVLLPCSCQFSVQNPWSGDICRHWQCEWMMWMMV